jgi:predicted O-linked N-acetylglucosamine transferase (SPINDLY family)
MDAARALQEGADHAKHARYEEARVALERAVALGAGAEALVMLAVARGELGDAEGAGRDFSRARSLKPTDPAIALLDATLLPTVYRDAGELEAWRSRYSDALASFVRDLPRYQADAHRVLAAARTNFLLAYQGKNDVELQRLLCEGLTGLLRQICPQYLEPRRRVGRARPRIGFVSAFLYDCTVGRYFGSWIEGLGDRFEVFAFMTRAYRDAYTERLERSCASFQVTSGSVLEIAAAIAAAELDVLVFPEVGMDARTRLLSCLRLAPAQAAGWGHPETTGSPEIDAYFSCEEMEQEGSDAHYTERQLLKLPGLGVAYELPPAPPPLTKEHLRLEAGRRAYCCPHSLFKLHPDSDEFLAEIMARDPEGVLFVFQEGPVPTQRFAGRFAATLERKGVPPRRQLRMLPHMSQTDFRRMLQAMDVLVDPLHWSGGNTALDALALGVPLVTNPGPLMRSRQAAAMLQRLDVPELVAQTPLQAAERAVELACDPALRAATRQRILENRPRLFDDAAPVRCFAESLNMLIG